MLKSSYGGISSPRGITFFGENYRASLFTPISIGWKGLKFKPAQVTIKKSIIKNEMKMLLGLFLIVDIFFNSKTFIYAQIAKLWSFTSDLLPEVSIPSEYVQPIIDLPWIPIVITFEIIIIILLIYSMKYTRKFHGAEHKAILAAENNDLENARTYTRIHPRCGTNIMPVYFIYVTILSYLFFPMMLGGTAIVLSIFTIQKIPPVGKIAEIIGGKLQLLTTKEPSEKQISNAIKSLQLLIDVEKNGIPNNEKELKVILE